MSQFQKSADLDPLQGHSHIHVFTTCSAKLRGKLCLGGPWTCTHVLQFSLRQNKLQGYTFKYDAF